MPLWKKKKKTLAYDLDGRIFSLKSQALLRVATQFASPSALGYVCFKGKQNKENILYPTACWWIEKHSWIENKWSVNEFPLLFSLQMILHSS